MNRYPWWKTLSILAVLVLGAVYALPNFYGSNPALEISHKRGATLDESLLTLVEDTLAEGNIRVRNVRMVG